MQALAEEPLLPLTKKQTGMIGADKAQASLRAQLRARGLKEMPAQRAHDDQILYLPSQCHGAGLGRYRMYRECPNLIGVNILHFLNRFTNFAFFVMGACGGNEFFVELGFVLIRRRYCVVPVGHLCGKGRGAHYT